MTVPVGGLPRHRALTDSLGVFEMDVEVSVRTYARLTDNGRGGHKYVFRAQQ